MVCMRALKGFCLGAGRDVAIGEEFITTERQATEWAWLGFAERLGVVDETAAQGGGAAC